jgi:hypothetical protein
VNQHHAAVRFQPAASPAVFYRLRELRAGDEIDVARAATNGSVTQADDPLGQPPAQLLADQDGAGLGSSGKVGAHVDLQQGPQVGPCHPWAGGGAPGASGGVVGPVRTGATWVLSVDDLPAMVDRTGA